MTWALLALIVCLVVAFGLLNGFMDGGSLVATVIATRALDPIPSLLLIACSELVGIILLGQHVASVVARQIALLPMATDPVTSLIVVVAALYGALLWTATMWRLTLPSSSSHALLGGLVGAAFAVYGISGVHWLMVGKIFALLAVIPLAGATLAFLFSKSLFWVGQYLYPEAGTVVKAMHMVALSGTALVHGSNDGQKLLGLLMLTSFAFPAYAGLWPTTASMALFCGACLVAGILIGSKRIAAAVGQHFYRVRLLQGFSAESATMMMVGICSLTGIPVSMTHVMSAAVVGAGSAIRPRGVRWGLAKDLAVIWLMTIPAAACVGGLLAKGAVILIHVVS